MLTPEERRGALLILGLVLLGAGWDAGRSLWKETPPPESPAPTAAAGAVGASDPPATSTMPAAARDSAGADPAPAVATVDVNRAGLAELDALPGIGPVLARRIIEHRGRNGAFRSLEELRAVRGIGPSLLARLRGHVRFSS